MKKTILLIMTICLSTLVRAEVFPYFGVDSVGSDFFREWYVTNDLVHYLDNGSDNVFYEAETTGEWNMPDQKLFSIAGNPYKWNKYYLILKFRVNFYLVSHMVRVILMIHI